MKGLIIWAYSNCRSTMALYGAVQKQAGFPVKIVVLTVKAACSIPDLRKNVGFRNDEFSDIEMTGLDRDFCLGLKIMDDNPGFTHLFCAYQNEPVYQKLIKEAHSRNEKVFIAGEAPCNMSSGWRWLVKEIYIRFVLRWKVREVVNIAEKFICFSGEAYKLAAFAGWTKDKVVPFGYFPPPLEKSRCVVRNNNSPFIILSTGILSKYRGADVLVNALKLLKDQGVKYRAIITQEGELLSKLKKTVFKYDLPVEFPGFMPMDQLVEAYQMCSVYVGSGRSEPWGMRLNDALNCGAPLIVSRSMGGVKLVDDLGCGESYSSNSPVELASKLQKLAEDKNLYCNIAQHIKNTCRFIDPGVNAKTLLSIIAA